MGNTQSCVPGCFRDGEQDSDGAPTNIPHAIQSPLKQTQHASTRTPPATESSILTLTGDGENSAAEADSSCDSDMGAATGRCTDTFRHSADDNAGLTYPEPTFVHSEPASPRDAANPHNDKESIEASEGVAIETAETQLPSPAKSQHDLVQTAAVKAALPPHHNQQMVQASDEILSKVELDENPSSQTYVNFQLVTDIAEFLVGNDGADSETVRVLDQDITQTGALATEAAVEPMHAATEYAAIAPRSARSTLTVSCTRHAASLTSPTPSFGMINSACSTRRMTALTGYSAFNANPTPCTGAEFNSDKFSDHDVHESPGATAATNSSGATTPVNTIPQASNSPPPSQTDALVQVLSDLQLQHCSPSHSRGHSEVSMASYSRYADAVLDCALENQNACAIAPNTMTTAAMCTYTPCNSPNPVSIRDRVSHYAFVPLNRPLGADGGIRQDCMPGLPVSRIRDQGGIPTPEAVGNWISCEDVFINFSRGRASIQSPGNHHRPTLGMLPHQQLAGDTSVGGHGEAQEEVLPEEAMMASVLVPFAFRPQANFEEESETKLAAEEEDEAAEGREGGNLLAGAEGKTSSNDTPGGVVDTVTRVGVPFMQTSYPQLMTSSGESYSYSGAPFSPIVEGSGDTNDGRPGIAALHDRSSASAPGAIDELGGSEHQGFSASRKHSQEEGKSEKEVVTRADRCDSQYSNSSPDSRHCSVSGTTMSDKGSTKSFSKRLRKVAGRIMRAASV